MSSWFEKFLSHYKLKVSKIYREADSVDQVGIDAAMLVLYTYITSCNLCDVYNMDKIRLFYNMMPDQIIIQL